MGQRLLEEEKCRVSERHRVREMEQEGERERGRAGGGSVRPLAFAVLRSSVYRILTTNMLEISMQKSAEIVSSLQFAGTLLALLGGHTIITMSFVTRGMYVGVCACLLGIHVYMLVPACTCMPLHVHGCICMHIHVHA